MITMIGSFEISSFATDSTKSKFTSLSTEIMCQISREFIIANLQDTLETAKTKIRKNITNLALVSRFFYKEIFNIIDKIPNSWDYFEITIDESSKNRNFDQIIQQCETHLQERREKNLGENQFFLPLFFSICFNKINFKHDNFNQLEKIREPFFAHIKKFRFVGVRIPRETLVPFQNSLKSFNYLAAIDTQAKINKELSIQISKTLFSVLEKFSFLHDRLQSLTLNFNCLQKHEAKEYTIQKQLISTSMTTYSHITFIDFNDISNILLKFSKLEEIGLISADLKPGDSHQLREVLSKFSRTLQYVNLSENKNIDNAFLKDALFELNLNALKVLNVSQTQVNQDCQVYPQCKNLTHLIMRECADLDTTSKTL